jgi:uncharacterized protein YcfJ
VVAFSVIVWKLPQARRKRGFAARVVKTTELYENVKTKVNMMKSSINPAQGQTRVWSFHAGISAAMTQQKTLLALILALFPALSAWAGGQIIDVPVISSYPVYQTVVREVPREQCHIEQVVRSHSGRGSATPAIVGTIIGGALGNAVGSKKKNKQVGAVVGGILGYSIGRDVGRRSAEKHTSHGYEDQEVCSTVYERVEEERLNGYDVSYAYAGQTYKTRMSSDPGSTIRVRVQVKPI